MPSQKPVFAAEDITRVLRALVRAEQDELTRKGLLPQNHHVDVLTGPGRWSSFEDLKVDEGDLGFDSLARLALVERVNRFFNLGTTGVEDYLLVRRSIGEWVELVTHHLAEVRTDATFTFSTSGSTGSPSHHLHTWNALTSEVVAHCTTVLEQADHVNRVLVSVPVHHIYGFLWGVLIPRQLGISAVDLPYGAAGPVNRTAEPRDLVVTTPFGWQALSSTRIKLPDQVVGLSSGGPTTQETWTQAGICGLRMLIEVYGASETGGLGWRTSRDMPFTLCADIARSQSSETSEPVLSRPGNPNNLDVQDHLRFVEPTLFNVLGRKDAQVQVGGVNVSPTHVARLLEELPEVQTAAVRLGTERLKAFIVPAAGITDTSALELGLRKHLTQLPPPARPQNFSFGQELPRTASGKLADWIAVGS